MIAFLEVVLRLPNAQILPLNSWKAVPGSPNAAMRAVEVVVHQQPPAWLHWTRRN